MDTNVIGSLVDQVENYDAHIQENDSKEIIKREPLTGHIDLTMKYYGRLWDEKGVGDLLERFTRRMWGGLTAQGKLFLKDMVFGIPLFHDIGKINPQFQAQKMKNRRVAWDNVFGGIGGRHSLLSAVVYIDYFLRELKERVEDREDKKRLRPLAVFHAYVIERHHSDLGKFEAFLDVLEGDRGNELLDVLREGRCPAFHGPFTLDGGRMRDLARSCRRYTLSRGACRSAPARRACITGCPDGHTESSSREQRIGFYTYMRMLYSLLVAGDYYATTEFMTGTQVDGSGNLDEIEEWIELFETTETMRSVREYQKNEYPKDAEALKTAKEINCLRTEMLSDAERVMEKNMGEFLFYLDAPTGSGKSNTALDLSLQMIKEDARLKKIYYIYPFNTLVEQNMESLRKTFGGEPKIMDSIAVINSLTPIKMTRAAKREEAESEQTMYYQQALLDRQFLNYPMVLSTHVSLFDTMFGDRKESAFGFHQLMNSVIVLDEIQSYKNTIWGEIVCFLKEFAHLMNMRVIIMSATLPDLDLLSGRADPAVRLLTDKEKYFLNPCFRERVVSSYELLGAEDAEGALFEHMLYSAKKGKKILVEFIKKDSAYRFFRKLAEEKAITCDVEYMSGDDSLMERSRILSKAKEAGRPMILVATQVIEAGVDLDMDIGYKNISKLDSEEQFLGRINRSCLRTGVVYFFKLDDGKTIYRDDIRMGREFTLENEEMREILDNKNFSDYYERIVEVLKRNYNDQVGEGGIEAFFSESVGKLDWPRVKERMELISEDRWSMSVYLARMLEPENGDCLDGRRLWREYVELLNDFKMDYAQKKVRLSGITSRMNCFIYQIKQNDDLVYNDKVGEIFYVEDGEKYFVEGKLDRKKVQGELGEFVDFL